MFFRAGRTGARVISSDGKRALFADQTAFGKTPRGTLSTLE
jgi:hypothetical protein